MADDLEEAARQKKKKMVKAVEVQEEEVEL